VNPCQPVVCAAVADPSGNDGNATWPAATAGAVVSGTCVAGHVGAPTRTCAAGAPGVGAGVLGPVQGACQAAACPAVDDRANPSLNASFAATPVGSVAVGTCAAGTFGAPQRQCLADGVSSVGVWSSTLLRNPCTGTLARGVCMCVREHLCVYV
jgi:hypothetical protein